MSKALRHAPEPWVLVNDGATIHVKDAMGRPVCTLYKDHQNLEGNAALIAGAPELSNAVFVFLRDPLLPYREALAKVWKKVRGVK